MSKDNIKLVYIGKGAFLPNIPARNLTDDEVKQYGGVASLVKSGLYQTIATKELKKKDGK